MESKLIDQLESLTRSGLFGPVVKALQNVNIKKIPRHEIARFANLANRVDFAPFALRILGPIVRGEEGLLVAPNDTEKSEYAEALRRMGLIGEAMQIFSEVDSSIFPVTLLRTALCLFMQWKYEEAIPFLTRYREAVQNDEYAFRIATINLAAAFVAERLDGPALNLLEPLRRETKEAKNQLLYLNSLELMTQVFVHRRDWSAVENSMREAMQVITDTNTRYARYVRKWRSIAGSLQNNSVSEELTACRAEARRNRDWETIRECDLYIAHINRDYRRLEYIYFGTPYASYRRRILELVGNDLSLDSTCIWNLKGDKQSQDVLDLATGNLEAGGPALETGQVQHRLMVLLCRDFYRPLSQGAAFSGLYPGEHFMQEGSANRVCQSVRRLRSLLKRISPGMQIEIATNGYRIDGDGALAIRVPREPLPFHARELEWNAVKRSLNETVFSKRDVMRIQNCSDSAARRLLHWATASGHAQIVVWGSRTTYKLAG